MQQKYKVVEVTRNTEHLVRCVDRLAEETFLDLVLNSHEPFHEEIQGFEAVVVMVYYFSQNELFGLKLGAWENIDWQAELGGLRHGCF